MQVASRLHKVSAGEWRMRDTFMMVLVAVGVYAAVRYFQPSHPLTIQANQTQTEKKHAGNHSGKNKKIQELGENGSQAEGDSGSIAETENLNSIYSQNHEVGQTVAYRSKTRKPKKVVIGVPVEAYVASRRNALGGGDVTAPEELGIRVFFQCMELKKEGPQTLAQRECSQLARTPSLAKKVSNVQ